MTSIDISFANGNTESKPKTLSEMFDLGMQLYNDLDSTVEASNTPEFQHKLKRAMLCLETATELVSERGMFSRNENVDEVATADLRYMLLPGLLGVLTLKLIGSSRKDVVEVAEVYFKDFLRRCKEYEVQGADQAADIRTGVSTVGSGSLSGTSSLERVVVNRATKIQRFNEQKQLKVQLADLERNVRNEHADEELKRSYFLTMLRLFIYQAVDELASIDMEKPILEHMNSNQVKKEPRTPPRRLRPVIITRDEVQKAVFGAGYPSLPTMTVQEFYAQRVADGVFPGSDQQQGHHRDVSLQQVALAGLQLNSTDDASTEKEAINRERKEEQDDVEHLAQLRAHDEYKDEHRRGEGNRMNRS